jgi:general secretion pathway protein C
MRQLLLDRSNIAQTAVVSLVTFAALALLGLVLAYWTWAWLAPRPEPRAQAAVQAGGRVEAAYGLFGSAQRDRNGAAPAGIAVRLLGVVAASGSRPGYAVLRLDAKKTVAVLQGADVEPGLRLAEVHVDHIVLERNGARETLAWPEKSRK